MISKNLPENLPAQSFNRGRFQDILDFFLLVSRYEKLNCYRVNLAAFALKCLVDLRIPKVVHKKERKVVKNITFM